MLQVPIRTNRCAALSGSAKICGPKSIAEGTNTALISNETQDDIIALVVFGFTLAIIVGVLGYVIGRFRR